MSALLAAALVQGCGGSASTSSVPLEDFPKRLAKVVCDSLVGCCRALSLSLDPATCNANANSYFQKTFGAQDRSRIRYDGNDADACLSAYGAALSGCILDEADGQALVVACQPVFVGLVPVGGACKSGDECAVPASGQARCEFFGSGSGGEGTCVVDTSFPGAALHGKQGEACAGSCASSTCGGVSPSGPGGGSTTTCFASEGLYCSEQGTCQPELADGQACSYFECKQESFCAAAGTCVPKKPDGAACVESSECLAHNCAYPGDSASSAGTCGVPSLADAKTCAGNFE